MNGTLDREASVLAAFVLLGLAQCAWFTVPPSLVDRRAFAGYKSISISRTSAVIAFERRALPMSLFRIDSNSLARR